MISEPGFHIMENPVQHFVETVTGLGAFDAAIDLGILVAPALALRTHAAIGRIDPILLGAALPALVAMPAALLVKETRKASPSTS